MSDYVAQSDLAGLIPLADLIEALDDDNDGAADPAAWAQVLALLSEEINAALRSGGYPAPCPGPLLPPLITRAAKLLAVNELWLRRGVKDHPRVKEVEAVRNDLARLAKGTIQLDADTGAGPAGSAITEALQTRPAGGGILA